MLIENLKEYADHYNIERAIPSIGDGLKPVQRKLLYIAIEQNLKKKKLLQFIGETMKIYTHGDNALVEAAYRMAQPWKQTYPLFTGEGNLGSQASLGLSGSGAAAARYLTMSLSPFGQAYREIHKTGINTMTINPLTGIKEPDNLFIPVPAFLLYNQLGIGVGVATNFPSFTLQSVIDATIALIKDKNTEITLNPVFQSGCEVVNKNQLSKVLAGEASLKLRAKYEIKGDTIDIHSFPPNTCPQYIISEIEKIQDKFLIFQNIIDMQDISSINKGKVDVRLRIKLKKSTHKEAFIKALNLETSCETTVPFNLTLLGIDNKPHKYSAKSALQEWIVLYKSKMQEILKMEQNELQVKIETLEGLLKALDDIDAIIDLIKQSTDKNEAREKLILRSYSIIQANAILDMRLSKLANMEYQDLLLNLEQLNAKINKINTILNVEANFIQYLIDILESHRKYEIYAKGCDISDSATVKIKDKTIDTHTVKAVKNKLVIDKGGIDIKDCVMIIGNRAKAVTISNSNLKVDALLDRTMGSKLLVTVSKDNRIKATLINELINSRDVLFSKQENICAWLICDESQHIEITTNKGKLSFAISDIPISGKGTLGVKAVKLKDDEQILNAKLIESSIGKRYTATKK